MSFKLGTEPILRFESNSISGNKLTDAICWKLCSSGTFSSGPYIYIVVAGNSLGANTSIGLSKCTILYGLCSLLSIT